MIDSIALFNNFDKAMEAILLSAGIVAFAELGDKTQLLAFVLAARYRKPVPIVVGILIATLANHALAGAIGVWVSSALSHETLRWTVGLSFMGMAIWTLVPDSLDEGVVRTHGAGGIFTTTLLTFFMAEMGDKTQLATVVLAARYESLWLVVTGTTLGMLIADVPAVFVGKKFAQKISMHWVRALAATLFALMGVAVLVKIERLL